MRSSAGAAVEAQAIHDQWDNASGVPVSIGLASRTEGFGDGAGFVERQRTWRCMRRSVRVGAWSERAEQGSALRSRRRKVFAGSAAHMVDFAAVLKRCGGDTSFANKVKAERFRTRCGVQVEKIEKA